MSKTKNAYEELICDLANITGYSFNFLLERFNEAMTEDGDIYYFIGVTLEKDW